MVLSYSRKAYSEAISRQDRETFLLFLENGLRSLANVVTRRQMMFVIIIWSALAAGGFALCGVRDLLTSYAVGHVVYSATWIPIREEIVP